MKRTRIFKHLAVAIGLGLGLGAASASAQGTIEVGGASTIGDSTLTSGSLATDVKDNWSTDGGEGTVLSDLVSPAVVVGATGNVTLTFDHRYNFEPQGDEAWDGGALYLSVNGGDATYVDSSAFVAPPGPGDDRSYRGSGFDASSIWATTQFVFTGASNGFSTFETTQTVVNLGSLTAGDTVSVIFRGGWDAGFIQTPAPNWEVSTVQITDTGGTLLDVDFAADGEAGFTVVNDGTVAGPWTYPKVIHRFEIDGDTLDADTYAPTTPGTVIDLNDAVIEVSLFAGTLGAGDSFTLFDLSGGTTLTGSVAVLNLPGGQWDTSTFETDGTITCLDPASPLIYEPFADLDPTLNGNTPGLGLTGQWSGQAAVTDSSLIYGGLAYSGGRVVTNAGNQFDQCGVSPGTTLTDAGLMDDGATLWFSCVIVKHEVQSGTSDRRTYVSIGTGVPDGFDRIGGNGGSGYTIAVNKNNNAVQARGWNDGSDGGGGAFGGALDTSVPEGATFLAVGKITWGQFGTTQDVFDLYLPDEDLNLGPVVSSLSADFDQTGGSNADNAFDTIGFAGGRPQNLVPEVDEIRFGASATDVLPFDVSPPELVSTDPADDSPNGNGSQQIATFNEPVFVGSGDIRIVNDSDTVTSTIAVTSSQIVVSGNTLTITPTGGLIGGKNYHIEIDAGAVTNYNLLDYAGIANATEWNFTADGTPPTVASITDDVSPLPLLTATSVTYTVTFNEAIDASTVSTTDFANGDSAGVTIDSVSATANPAAFEVVVSAVSAGDLTLEVVMGAVIRDLTGNALDSASAVTDDTTITVNNPTPTAASMAVDFQGTIASEQNANGSGEGRYYHVSVNANNAGTGWYCADLPNSGTDGPPGTRFFTGPVEAYKWVGGGSNSLQVAVSGGNASLIEHTTPDDTFDGFGQQQLRLWTGNDPGSDIATTAGLSASGFSAQTSGYRSFGGAVGTVDISGLASGSLHIYYGAFGATPSVKVTLKDTDNVAADLVLNDAHSIADGGNGDAANRTEYYLAEIDFVTDGFYDVIEYEWLANGSDYTGNGRGLGTLLTGPDVVTSTPYSEWASSEGLTTGVNDAQTDDADSGGQNNFYEFAFGGDPLDGNDDGALMHAFTADADGDTDDDAVLTVLVRAGGVWTYSGPEATATIDGVNYSIAGSATIPVSGAINVLEGTTVITTGLPAAPFGYEYKSFILDGSVDEGLGEGYFQATVTAAP